MRRSAHLLEKEAHEHRHGAPRRMPVSARRVGRRRNVEMRPADVLRKDGEKGRSTGGAAVAHRRLIGDVGGGRLHQLGILGSDGQAPDVVERVAACLDEVVRERIVGCEEAAVGGAERNAAGSRQGGRVDDEFGLLTGGPRQGVRENHAALAVGVEDLNRLAREGGDDVARLGGAARGKVLAGRHDAEKVDGQFGAGGGHFAAKPELLYKLVNEAPEAILWLNELGVEFDKDKDGTMITTHGGGTSRKRMHAAKDYSGAEIMRTLRDEVLNRNIPVVDFTAAIELILDDNGKAAGAVLMNMETKEILIARAKTVIIATGGAGRLHYQGFPTSNHYGATADGLVLGYRAGAKLLYADTLQYHPTGAAYPEQIFGALVTEKVRSLGAKLINVDGEAFMHPLETRDVAAASIIRECTARGKGVKALDGVALWLDTPLIEMLHGEGTIAKRIPGMLRMYAKFGIDLRKEPILIYPTLHYQNGGILIDKDAETKLPGLFVAGEAVGGIHGTNRLMGNSLLDIIVFGRIAGTKAAEAAKSVKLGKLSLEHVRRYAEEEKAAGVHGELSPKLLPVYTHGRDVR